eukprot:3450758-Prymnesium_polylepis.1
MARRHDIGSSSSSSSSSSTEPTDALAAHVESYVAMLDLDSSPKQHSSAMSYILMTSYCGVCALSLAGGAIAGNR